MQKVREVKLFRNGRNQAVRIPREFEMPGNQAILRKVGHRLILEPARSQSLLAALAAMSPLGPEEGFPDVDGTLPALDEDPLSL